MAVYKDKKRGTWYTSFLYVDWTGKRCRKLKRGFLTKKAAQNWENHFKLQKANSLDMTFQIKQFLRIARSYILKWFQIVLRTNIYSDMRQI